MDIVKIMIFHLQEFEPLFWCLSHLVARKACCMKIRCLTDPNIAFVRVQVKLQHWLLGYIYVYIYIYIRIICVYIFNLCVYTYSPPKNRNTLTRCVFYPTFPEFFVHRNPCQLTRRWGNGGAVALANAFAMGCGEKLQTIILDENDIGAAGGSKMDLYMIHLGSTPKMSVANTCSNRGGDDCILGWG